MVMVIGHRTLAVRRAGEWASERSRRGQRTMRLLMLMYMFD
jgi:hypothetical protein